MTTISINTDVLAIFILNACNAHPIYSTAEMNDGGDESTLANIEEIDLSGQNEKGKRISIYVMMLSYITDEE